MQRRRFRKGARLIGDPTPYFERISRKEARAILREAEDFDRATKGKGSRRGALGYVARDVLSVLMFRVYNFASGACFPAYETIAALTGHSKSAVIVGVADLERHGFLDIVRRRITEIVDGVRQERQGSNIYRFRLPSREKLAAMIKGAMRTVTRLPVFKAAAKLAMWRPRRKERPVEDRGPNLFEWRPSTPAAARTPALLASALVRKPAYHPR